MDPKKFMPDPDRPDTEFEKNTLKKFTISPKSAQFLNKSFFKNNFPKRL
jgi:hypothetical protein